MDELRDPHWDVSLNTYGLSGTANLRVHIAEELSRIINYIQSDNTTIHISPAYNTKGQPSLNPFLSASKVR